MRKFIGNKAFYKNMLMVAIPIMIQNGITNFVSLLDNIMVGRVGTEQMSGVSIANQLIFVYNLCIFGALSGAGIFTAQYFGRKDKEGIQHTFRFKLIISSVVTIIGLLIFIFLGNTLIQYYLNGEGNIQDTLFYGRQYLNIMMIGMPAFMMMQVYSNTLRECSETIVPMKSGLIAVFVNLVGNYILIYGKFGLPAFGSAGAAIATVISRYVEASINIGWAHTHKERCFFMEGMYKKLLVPFHLFKRFFITGMPLLVNETMWAAGMAMLTQCYSTRGLEVVAGLNISNTINNVANTAFLALGVAVGILVGQQLGAEKVEEAKETVYKTTAFSIFVCMVIMVIMIVLAPIFPKIYNTGEEAQTIAKQFIIVQAIFMPLQSYINCVYFTLRAGGKTFVTFLFDSVYVWVVGVSIAFVLSRFTPMAVVYIFFCVQLADIMKAIVGTVLIKKGVWIHNIAN